MEIKEAYKLAFQEDYEKFQKSYKLLTQENVKRNNNLLDEAVVSIYTAEPIQAFIYLAKCIHDAAVVLDKSNKKPSESAFIGGVKHIDNIIKHNKTISILNLLQTGTKTVGSVINGQFIVRFYYICSWKNIDSIPCNVDWNEQRNNYNNYIRDTEVDEMLSKLKSIIDTK